MRYARIYRSTYKNCSWVPSGGRYDDMHTAKIPRLAGFICLPLGWFE